MRRTRGLWASIIFVGVLVVASLVGLLTDRLSPRLGLDLEGGVSVILRAPDGTSADTMEQARANIDRRVNALGVAEPDISVQGTNIEVQLPGLAKGTIEQRPERQSCIEGSDTTSYGCFDTHEAAQTAADALKVEEQTTQVCLVGEDDEQIFPCFVGETAAQDAKAALKGITAQEQTTGETKGQFCLQDPSGAQFGCFDTKEQADAAVEALGTDAETQFCITGSDGVTLPCSADEGEATSLADSLKVVDETSLFCVVSSDDQDLGCFLDQEKAQVALQRTGQGELLRIIGTTARLEQREVLQAIPAGGSGYDAAPGHLRQRPRDDRRPGLPRRARAAGERDRGVPGRGRHEVSAVRRQAGGGSDQERPGRLPLGVAGRDARMGRRLHLDGGGRHGVRRPHHRDGGQAAGDRAGRQRDLRTDDREPDHGRIRRDHRQFRRGPGQVPRGRAAGRRPAGGARAAAGADGEPHPGSGVAGPGHQGGRGRASWPSSCTCSSTTGSWASSRGSACRSGRSWRWRWCPWRGSGSDTASRWRVSRDW